MVTDKYTVIGSKNGIIITLDKSMVNIKPKKVTIDMDTIILTHEEYTVKIPARKALYLASPKKRRINVVVFLTCKNKNPDGKVYLVSLCKS